MKKKRKKVINYFKDMDKVLFFISLILILFGTLNIVTASSREAVVNAEKGVFYYFFRHFIFLCAGTVGYRIIIKMPTKRYCWFIKYLYLIFLGLNFYLIVKGVATRGANNWIGVGFFKFQPSEFTKPLLIIYMSILFEKYNKKLKDPNIKHDIIIWKIICYGLIGPLFVFLQKDLGTAVILLFIFVVLFLSSPISFKEKIKSIIVVSIVGVVGLIFMMAYSGSILTSAQLSRFDFFNPCSKYETSGYQVCNAFIAINNGGLTGVGLGKSTQKYSYIPEAHTDMVFAIIAEENGFIICTIIFIFYIIIIYRILKLSRNTLNIKNKYICIGTSAYIFAHIFINLGGLFGIIPLTGVPLPFFSYGGSFTLCIIAMLGVIQRVHIEYRNTNIKLKTQTV